MSATTPTKEEKDRKNAQMLIELFPVDLGSTQQKSMFIGLLQDFMVDLKKFRITKTFVNSTFFVKLKVTMSDSEIAGLASSFADHTGYQNKLCEDAVRAVYNMFSLAHEFRAQQNKGATP